MNLNDWHNPPDWMHWFALVLWICGIAFALAVIWIVIMPVVTLVLAFIVMVFVAWLGIRWVGQRIEDWFR